MLYYAITCFSINKGTRVWAFLKSFPTEEWGQNPFMHMLRPGRSRCQGSWPSAKPSWASPWSSWPASPCWSLGCWFSRYPRWCSACCRYDLKAGNFGHTRFWMLWIDLIIGPTCSYFLYDSLLIVGILLQSLVGRTTQKIIYIFCVYTYRL